jgi:hypothetical protein
MPSRVRLNITFVHLAAPPRHLRCFGFSAGAPRADLVRPHRGLGFADVCCGDQSWIFEKPSGDLFDRGGRYSGEFGSVLQEAPLVQALAP